MTYFLGIDGGGTKTEAVLANEHGFVVSIGKSGGSNPNFVGRDVSFASIICATKAALSYINNKMVEQVVVCIPGIKKYSEELYQQLHKLLNVDKSKILIDDDELNSFYGALGKEYGAVVLAGTGSFAMGVNKEGQKCVIGGWGPIIGDEGSGHWIALQALKAVAREHDGIGPTTLLTNMIMRQYGVSNASDIRKVASLDNISVLVPLVLEAAQKGDSIALSIIYRAGIELAKMANAVISKLDLDNGFYDVALAGGISNLGDLIWVSFTATIRSLHERINIIKPKFTPGVGAVMIALKRVGIEWDNNIMNNLKTSYEERVR